MDLLHLEVLRGRFERLPMECNLRHSLVYLPCHKEAELLDLLRIKDTERQQLRTEYPIGPGGKKTRVLSSCLSRESLFAGVSNGYAVYDPAEEKTLEFLWSDEDAARFFDEVEPDSPELQIVAESVDARNRWDRLSSMAWQAVSGDRELLEPFVVDSTAGPQLATSATRKDWARLLHLAAWSGKVSGLTATVARYHILDDGRVFGTTHDRVAPWNLSLVSTGIIPGKSDRLSKSYLSTLDVDTTMASLLFLGYAAALPREEHGEMAIAAAGRGAGVDRDRHRTLINNPSASEDFTSVVWNGIRYRFSKGNQAESIKVLWNAWNDGAGHGLKQETIGEKIGSTATRFELSKVFRRRKADGPGYVQHEAWGKLILEDGKGCYRLADVE